MAQTIIYAGGTIAPVAILGYTSRRAAGNIVHPILGRESPDVTLRPAMPRTGTLHLGFTDEAASKAAEDAHATGAGFTLLASDRTSVEMYYVVAGAIERELESETRSHWILRVDFQEVLVS